MLAVIYLLFFSLKLQGFFADVFRKFGPENAHVHYHLVQIVASKPSILYEKASRYLGMFKLILFSKKCYFFRRKLKVYFINLAISNSVYLILSISDPKHVYFVFIGLVLLIFYSIDLLNVHLIYI